MTDTGGTENEPALGAWTQLVRVSRVLLERVEAELKAAGLPPLIWYDVLLELRRAAPAGLRPFELQQRMLLAQPNTSRLLDRMKKAGYVERRPCAEDGRGQILSITGEGRALMKRMWPVYREAITTYFADRLSPRDIQSLSRMLRKLKEA